MDGVGAKHGERRDPLARREMEYEMQTDSRRLNYHALQSECVQRAHIYAHANVRFTTHPLVGWLSPAARALTL